MAVVRGCVGVQACGLGGCFCLAACNECFESLSLVCRCWGRREKGRFGLARPFRRFRMTSSRMKVFTWGARRRRTTFLAEIISFSVIFLNHSLSLSLCSFTIFVGSLFLSNCFFSLFLYFLSLSRLFYSLSMCSLSLCSLFLYVFLSLFFYSLSLSLSLCSLVLFFSSCSFSLSVFLLSLSLTVISFWTSVWECRGRQLSFFVFISIYVRLLSTLYISLFIHLSFVRFPRYEFDRFRFAD